MPILEYTIGNLPASPLDAACAFYQEQLARIRDDLDRLAQHDLVLVFRPAGFEHKAWRLAAVQELARELAPRRANAIASDDAAAVAKTLAYLENAPGVTGQYLPLIQQA